MANLYDKPDDLDPQPEFPLRTELTFYKDEAWEPPKLEILEGDVMGEVGSPKQASSRSVVTEQSNFPSAVLMLILWILGLCAWCSMFLQPVSSSSLRTKKSRKKSSSTKMAKDV